MTIDEFISIFGRKPLIGVIHLPRLPSTMYSADMGVEEIIENSVREAKMLEEHGFKGVIVENFGDKPYYKRVTDPLTLSIIAIVSREIVRSTSLVVGVNILRNSGVEAYSVALASGGRFIRVNSLSETIVSDSGIIEPEAPRLKGVRINHPGIKVFADILVKHSASLSFNLLYSQGLYLGDASGGKDHIIKTIIEDTVERGGADAIILTGYRTGEPVDADLVKKARSLTQTPIVIGSGIDPENIRVLSSYSDGFIVGSYIRVKGRAGNPICEDRIKKLVSAYRASIG